MVQDFPYHEIYWCHNNKQVLVMKYILNDKSEHHERFLIMINLDYEKRLQHFRL